MDEALGRAVLRFPVFPENLKKTPKETETFLIYVWLIHSDFSFHDFFFLFGKRGGKKKDPSPILIGNLARLLSSPGKWFLQQTHLGNFTPFPDGSCQILPRIAAGMAPRSQRGKKRKICFCLIGKWVDWEENR